MASGIDMKAGSVFTWTSISSSASSAIHSSVAATAAIGSPTYRTFSRANASSSWLTGRMPNLMGRSSPVRAASTPGSARARVVSTRTILACGCGLRRILPKSILGSARSSANLVCPLTLAKASGLVSDLPTTARSSITALASRGREFDGLEDLEVTGAATEYAGKRILDRVSGWVGVPVEQRPGGEQHRRRAIPALRGAQFGKRDLEGMQLTPVRHPFHRGDLASLEVERHGQAGQVRPAIDEHATGGALAQLAAVLGPGQSQVFAQDLQQCFVGRHHDRHLFAVDAQADGDPVRDRHALTVRSQMSRRGSWMSTLRGRAGSGGSTMAVRTHSCGGTSGRNPLKIGKRNCPLRSHSLNLTATTMRGSIQQIRSSDQRGSSGGDALGRPSSIFRMRRDATLSKPPPTLPAGWKCRPS